MNELFAFAGIALLITIQISLFAYGYGKLSQQVQGNYHRLDKLEERVSQMEKTVSKLDITVAKSNAKL